jgi:hypothetical protein
MKDYIVLKGADAIFNASTNRLQWNNIDNRFFPNYANSGVPDGNVDMFMKLNAIRFAVGVDNDDISTAIEIDTDLNFNNMVPTSSSSLLGIVFCNYDNNNANAVFLKPSSIMSDIQLKISRFNSIQIGLIQMDAYLQMDNLRALFTVVLEIEYIRNEKYKELH